jgi:hypothetical protein
MKKDTVWLIVAIVLLLGVVGGLVWIFGGFSGSDSEVPETGDSNNQVTESQNGEEETNVEDNTEGDSNPNTAEEENTNEELGDAEVDSSVSYSTSSQSVGEDTEELYTLDDVKVNKGEDVVEITYSFTGDSITEDSSIPVSASNKSSLGTMDIIINNVKTDSSGMSYNDSVSINKDGLTKLTKVVSGEGNTLKYGLGFADAPEFYLYEPEISDNSLIVKLSVKYPGGDISTDEFGTTEFTAEDVTVESSTSDNGVRISGYSYSTSGGVLRYVFKTSSNTGSPVPSFNGSIEDGVLTVTFPSLSADIIYSSTGGTVSLPSGVTLNISRSGGESLYEFVGIGDQYKLYGETSPNQVIVEVKL